MNKEKFLNEVENKLSKLSFEDKQLELKRLSDYIENGKMKNISEEEIIKSLGDINDVVKTIYVQRGMVSNKENHRLVDKIVSIWNGIIINFKSKDKKIIFSTISTLVIIVLVAIILKIPFIFIKTLFLDFLNISNLTIEIQNLVATLFEVIYLIIAIIYIYKRLKKCFIK